MGIDSPYMAANGEKYMSPQCPYMGPGHFDYVGH